MVYCYFVRALYEMTYLPCSLRASRRYLNIADQTAVQHFISLTYEKYEQYLKEPRGNRIEAIFTDEPSLMHFREYPKNRPTGSATKYPSKSVYDVPDLQIPAYPYVPWTNDFREQFQNAYGYDITKMLPELFDETQQTGSVRCDFYGFINKLTEKSYMQTLHNYTASQNMLLSGHYINEETFDRQPFIYGDILNHLGKMDIPGCDMLFAAPNALRYSVACKFASSAAHIYHKKHAMIEASNMLDTDQHFTLDNMIESMSIIVAHGIDTITSYFAEKLLSDEDTKKYTRYVSRLNRLFDGGANKIDALLYYPFEQLCAACNPDGPNIVHTSDTFHIKETTEMLFKNQIGFDFINKEVLLRCRIVGNRLVTDYGEAVHTIVFPEISWMDRQTALFLEKAHQSGVKILFCGPSRVIDGLSFVPIFQPYTQKPKIEHVDLHFNTDMPETVFLHKTICDTHVYLLVNTSDSNCNIPIDVPQTGNAVYTTNLLTDTAQASPVDYAVQNGRMYFTLAIKAHAPAIFFIA